MKISRRWRKMAEQVYKPIALSVCPIGLDFSEEAAQAAFDFESQGVRSNLKSNGYAVGKQWTNVQVAEWKVGIQEGLFSREELLDDNTLPRWWIESVLKDPEFREDVIQTIKMIGFEKAKEILKAPPIET